MSQQTLASYLQGMPKCCLINASNTWLREDKYLWLSEICLHAFHWLMNAAYTLLCRCFGKCLTCIIALYKILLLCFLTGTSYCVALSAVLNFDHLGECYVVAKLKDHDVHLIFDRYYDYSAKSAAQKDIRTCSRVHQLDRDQNQDATEQAHFLGHLGRWIILSPCHTKSSTETDWTTQHPNNHFWGTNLSKLDLSYTHEEANFMITQHAVMAAQKGSLVTVIADDVYVFVLLVCYYTITYVIWLPLCTWFPQFQNEQALTLLKPLQGSKT